MLSGSNSGGLADYCENPAPFAIRTDDDQLNRVLAPLASKTVTSIIGFTELAGDRLYNAAAVFHLGRVAGLYRKLHPAIRRSVYSAGTQTPVFRVGGLTLGIVICNDSTFSEPAKAMAGQGATVLFIPTNNTLPAKRAYQGLLQEARASDFARVAENRFWVIRADVAGANGGLVSPALQGLSIPTAKLFKTHDRLARIYLSRMLLSDRSTLTAQCRVIVANGSKRRSGNRTTSGRMVGKPEVIAQVLVNVETGEVKSRKSTCPVSRLTKHYSRPADCGKLPSE